jgi:hypothetical protein
MRADISTFENLIKNQNNSFISEMNVFNSPFDLVTVANKYIKLIEEALNAPSSNIDEVMNNMNEVRRLQAHAEDQMLKAVVKEMESLQKSQSHLTLEQIEAKVDDYWENSEVFRRFDEIIKDDIVIEKMANITTEDDYIQRLVKKAEVLLKQYEQVEDLGYIDEADLRDVKTQLFSEFLDEKRDAAAVKAITEGWEPGAIGQHRALDSIDSIISKHPVVREFVTKMREGITKSVVSTPEAKSYVEDIINKVKPLAFKLQQEWRKVKPSFEDTSMYSPEMQSLKKTMRDTIDDFLVDYMGHYDDLEGTEEYEKIYQDAMSAVKDDPTLGRVIMEMGYGDVAHFMKDVYYD